MATQTVFAGSLFGWLQVIPQLSGYGPCKGRRSAPKGTMEIEVFALFSGPRTDSFSRWAPCSASSAEKNDDFGRQFDRAQQFYSAWFYLAYLLRSHRTERLSRCLGMSGTEQNHLETTQRTTPELCCGCTVDLVSVRLQTPHGPL